MKAREQNAINSMLMSGAGVGGGRGGSLMQRVASPIHGVEKANKGDWNASTTMGNTAPMTAGQSQISMPSQNSYRGGQHTSLFSHHSSPFSKTITRTMMTGVGFLGK